MANVHDNREDDAPHQAPPQDAPHSGGETSGLGRLWHQTWFKAVSGLVIVVLLAGGAYWWNNSEQYVSTTDAYIEAHMVQIAPRVAGRVVAVKVSANQAVKKGDLLVQIDPTVDQANLNEAKARLASGQAEVKQAEANARSAAAEASNADGVLKRDQSLSQDPSSVISRQQVDQALATYDSDKAKLAAANQSIAVAKAQAQVLEAAVHTASLKLGYTSIHAPQAGHIAKPAVAVGDYVTPGEALMALVPNHLWVTANFKETEIDRIHPGEPVTIAIDACGGRSVRGHVLSIQHGAGQAFQILPPENSTGNFVKVVQRVPVRFALDSLPKNCTLGPGMSVEPRISVTAH